MSEILFKHSEPFLQDNLQVSDTHNVYYEVNGNPEGENVLFLHGGPGSGCSSWCSGLFDPKKYKIVLIDQRGSGKSQPTAETKENTTQDLINDIELIREKLQIKQWFLIYGGSWGVCLALAYANYVLSEDYKGNLEKIQNIVIHGIFLGRMNEIQSTYESTGPGAQLYPDAYKDFIKPIEKLKGKKGLEDNLSIIQMYYNIFTNTDHIFSKEDVDFAILCWSQWESRIASSERTSDDWDAVDQSWLSNPSKLLSHSIIENYYFVNNCWHDGNIFLQDSFAKKLSKANVCVRIINGRFDLVCPPCTAYALHGNLISNQVNSKLEFTQAGHTILDSCNTKKIVSIINNELL